MEKRDTFKRGITTYQLFWPVVGLALLLLFNLLFTNSFFLLEIKDGHLYGSMIDILNRASVLMLLTIGMTLVIASGGIDISVGSVMAISSSTIAMLLSGKMLVINGQQQFVSIIPMGFAVVLTLGIAMLFGLMNGLLVSETSGDRRDVNTVGRGTRHCSINHQWQCHNSL